MFETLSKKLYVLRPWISNHKHKIEDKSTNSSRSSSKVVGLGLVDLWAFPTPCVPLKEKSVHIRKNPMLEYFACIGNIIVINSCIKIWIRSQLVKAVLSNSDFLIDIDNISITAVSQTSVKYKWLPHFRSVATQSPSFNKCERYIFVDIFVQRLCHYISSQ